MRETDATTANLIERAQSGDRDAYDELFANAAERLQLFIRMRLGAALRSRGQPGPGPGDVSRGP